MGFFGEVPGADGDVTGSTVVIGLLLGARRAAPRLGTVRPRSIPAGRPSEWASPGQLWVALKRMPPPRVHQVGADAP